MIPIKGKKYMLNCQGPFEWNRYMGEGVCTGEKEDFCGENGETFIYGFKIPLNDETCFFEEESIVAEFSDDNQVRPIICDPENYPEDDESPYCEKCGSCGEDGCCPPINCEAVKCKYGEINLKDYKSALDMVDKALYFAPKNLNFLKSKSIILRHLGRYPDLIEILNLISSLDPSDEEIKKTLIEINKAISATATQ